MSLIRLLQQAQGGQGVAGLADAIGLDRAEADRLAGMLAPAIGSAVRKRAERGDTETVARALEGEAQGGYFDDPAAAARPEGQAQGAAFLEQILGSREAPETLGQSAADRAGLDLDTVMRFLPALAAMLQGGMQRQMPDDRLREMAQGGGPVGGGGGLGGLIAGLLGGNRGQGSGGGLDMLTRMLDADGDGSVLDDVLDRFLRR